MMYLLQKLKLKHTFLQLTLIRCLQYVRDVSAISNTYFLKKLRLKKNVFQFSKKSSYFLNS